MPDKRLFILQNGDKPKGLNRKRLVVGAGLLVLGAIAVVGLMRVSADPHSQLEVSRPVPQGRRTAALYAKRRRMGEPHGRALPRARVPPAENVTEGKIAVDEDRSTPVFSPYAGRVTALLARPGDQVVQGAVAADHRSHRHRPEPRMISWQPSPR